MTLEREIYGVWEVVAWGVYDVIEENEHYYE
jgi:hypothetical protein